jgi:hypothetical protein
MKEKEFMIVGQNVIAVSDNPQEPLDPRLREIDAFARGAIPRRRELVHPYMPTSFRRSIKLHFPWCYPNFNLYRRNV